MGSRPADAPENERVLRTEFRTRPPDLLLTNYLMLEYMLMRKDGREIFKNHRVRYIVLDEVHTYHGTLGTDMTWNGWSMGCMNGTSARGGSRRPKRRTSSCERKTRSWGSSCRNSSFRPESALVWNGWASSRSVTPGSTRHLPGTPSSGYAPSISSDRASPLPRFG